MKSHCFLIPLMVFAIITQNLFGQEKDKPQNSQPKANQNINKQEQNNLKSEKVNIQIKNDGNIDVEQLFKAGKPLVTGNDSSKIDWTGQYVEAKGATFLNKTKWPDEEQAKEMALRGAVVVAQRNLLEIIQGAHVVGETTVKDMVTNSDIIYSRVDGVIKGAVMVGEPVVKGNKVQVTMRVPLYKSADGKFGVADVLQNDAKKIVIPNKSIEANSSTANNHTNNLKDTPIDPSLFPLLVDSSGNIIFDYREYYDPSTGKIPKYISVTKEVAKLLGANDKANNVLEGVSNAINDGKIIIQKGKDEKFNKWMNIIGTVVKIGTSVVSLF